MVKGLNKTYGERAFIVAAPRLWNKLSLQIRLSSSEAVFKGNLKTYLFKRAFDLQFLLFICNLILLCSVFNS